ncbi:MAG: amino acid permease [Pseudomonadota bacterium]|nr:amino acid permease [Pseudomonadota bacterium]
MSNPAKTFSARTAIMLVIANMIGTGVFTSLGYQLLDIRSAPVILLLWTLGGVIALCGALCYAELGAALPRSGGEYNFVGRIYHPAAGFVSGWISITVGFSAPTAAVAIAAAKYAQSVWPGLSETAFAAALVLLTGAIHLGSRRGSAVFQQAVTGIKVLVIVALVAAVWITLPSWQPLRWTPTLEDLPLIGSGGFAIALIYVNYAYTGWNAATYIGGEFDNPGRVLPKALIIATSSVMLLYLLLHVMFLSAAPMDAMAGRIEIGYVVAEYSFGVSAAKVIGVVLSLLLVSTIIAMLLAGPRALYVIGRDFSAFRWLGQENRYSVPANAVVLQIALTLLLIVTSTFDSIIIFSGAILALNSLVTVLGVWVLRMREPDLPRPFKVPLYPLPLIIFAALSLWTLVHLIEQRPVEGAMALGLIVLGLVFYAVSRKLQMAR